MKYPKISFRLSVAAFFIFAFLFSGTCYATTIMHTPFAKMCRDADAIIEGTVTSKNSRYAGAMIVTDVVLSDISNLKGNVSNPLTLTYLGGMIGDESSVVAGTPEFEIGEQKILFLHQIESDFSIFGMWEGAFTKREMIEEIGWMGIERADGYMVQGFDATTGELQFHTPGEFTSKPTILIEQQAFRDLIDDLQSPPKGGPAEIGE